MIVTLPFDAVRTRTPRLYPQSHVGTLFILRPRPFDWELDDDELAEENDPTPAYGTERPEVAS